VTHRPSYRALLFDLDGTLTDPKLGITRSIQYALRRRGLPVPHADELEPWIGPPLERSFRELAQLSAADARQAVSDYREYFEPTGMYENAVYAGIPELLAELGAAGVRLAVATSKPTALAEKILTHFALASHFESVTGSHLDGRRVAKDEVVSAALEAFDDLPRGHIAMVGDRLHDVHGARAHGIAAIAAGYGYGTRAELEAARPDALAESVRALGGLLLGLV
jgi:phosphoglycolate phosphatase